MCEHVVTIDKDKKTFQGNAKEEVDNNNNKMVQGKNANDTNNASNANITSTLNTNSELGNYNNEMVRGKKKNKKKKKKRKNRNRNNTNNADNTENANTTNNTDNANTTNTNSEEREKEPDKVIQVIDVLYKYMIFNAELPKEQKKKEAEIKMWKSLALGFLPGSVATVLAIMTCRLFFAANHEKLNSAEGKILTYSFAILVLMVYVFSLLIILAIQFSAYNDRLIKNTRVLGALLLFSVTIFVIGVIICIFFITPS